MSIREFSNPFIAERKAKKYFGPDVELKVSNNPKKKYMIHFGQMGYEDFTKHKDEKRRVCVGPGRKICIRRTTYREIFCGRRLFVVRCRIDIVPV